MVTDTQYHSEHQNSQHPGRSNGQNLDHNPIIHAGKNNACLNKTLKPGYSESALARFPIYQTTLKDLLKHIIVQGGAWSPGLHEKGHRTNENWQGAESLALDYDDNVSVADLLKSEIVQRYAVAVHPSASSSPNCFKSRVIIRLSTIERDFEHYRAVAAHIIAAIGLPADPVSERPAQFYFGSTNRIERPYVNLDAAPFDIATVEYTKSVTPQPEAPKVAAADFSGNERYGQVALERILADLRGLPTGRNSGGNHYARKAYGLKLDGYITTSETELEALLMDCEYANGYIAEHGEHKARAAIRSGFNTAAPGKNGRNPRERTLRPNGQEIAPEAESSTNLENFQIPDGILSSLLRNVSSIAPLARILMKSSFRVFTREQAKAIATARSMSESKFNHDWPLLFSPELQVLECIRGEYIDSNSCNEYRVVPCNLLIEQLRPLDRKWVYRVCHPIGPPPEPGQEDRRKLALPTAEMMRDSGIEDAEEVATELRQKTRQYTEKRTLYRAKRVLADIEASYFNPHETSIPDSSETHTVAALRTAYLNAYVSEHPGETLPRFEIMRLTGAANSSIKALTMRAGVKGETPDELPALAIHCPADIDRIIPHQGIVKGYPIQVTYTYQGETVTRGIDARKDAQGMRRVCTMALQSGAAVKVLYQTAKEYHVASAPLPTKERVKVKVGEGAAPVSRSDMERLDTPESEPTDPRKYPRRWLVGQYQLALERMGWKRDKFGVCNSEGEYAPDNPRALIELILGRSLGPIDPTDPDYYERPSTEYEQNARHDFRMEMIGQGWRLKV